MKQRRISRRTVLKGVGAVTIGLPLLEEMLATTAAAAEQKAVPVRAFNVFFGLGIPAPLQKEGFDGVLEPLKPLADKLLILRKVDQVRCDRAGDNAHYDGAIARVHGRATRRRGQSGRAVDRSSDSPAHYPDGLPAGYGSHAGGGNLLSAQPYRPLCT